jgi:hypothetical protein
MPTKSYNLKALERHPAPVCCSALVIWLSAIGCWLFKVQSLNSFVKSTSEVGKFKVQGFWPTLHHLVLLLVFFGGLARAYPGETNVLKYEEPRHLAGTIYSADRKKVLFKFFRACNRTGNRLSVSREYSYPDGTIALKEKIVYEGDRLREYDIDDLQIGSRGSAKLTDLSSKPAKSLISFEYFKEARSPNRKTDTEPFRDNCLISDMVAPFLVDHWSDLMKGNEVKCRYIVIDRRETVGFTFVKDSESRRAGRNVIIVKMFPTSRIISALVDPLFFTIEKDGRRRVLEYTGRAPVKIKDGSKWKDLDGVTVFDWDKP